AARTREQLEAVDLDAQALTSVRAETESAEARATELRATHDARFTTGDAPLTGVRAAAEAELADARRAADHADVRARTIERDLARARGDLDTVDAELAVIEPERSAVVELERAAGGL